ncbi:MAG: T9SS type A sorting domain-containing protein [Bacteroidota bacterium]
MKRNFTLLLIFLCISSFDLFAQELSNTSWALHDSLGNVFLHFQFGTDSVFFSSDNNSFSKLATYVENGNELTIVDLPDGPCGSSHDQGKYSFQISHDSLIFSVVEDPCINRTSTLTGFDWVLLSTSLHHGDRLSGIRIYPNPVSDFLIIENASITREGTFRILDQLGRNVLSGSLDQIKTITDLRSLPQGVYFVKLDSKGAIPLIKE